MTSTGSSEEKKLKRTSDAVDTFDTAFVAAVVVGKDAVETADAVNDIDVAVVVEH